MAPWHARRRATDGATVACGHAVPRVVTNFTVHCSAARASHRRTARLMSRENPRPQKRAKLSLQLRERDTRGLFVLGTTLHCAHGGCVPCCYKIFQHAGPSSTRLRPNERPELCHRLRAGLPSTEPPTASANGTGPRRCGMYDGRMHILTVGDGNFSFSLALARRLCPFDAGSLVATSHESAETVRRVYPDAAAHIDELTALGASVYHGVDATALDETLPATARRQYHRVVWNFPCIGRGLSAGSDGQNAEMDANKQLVQGFGASAARLLGPEAELHITHKTKPPYCQWMVAAQARAFAIGSPFSLRLVHAPLTAMCLISCPWSRRPRRVGCCPRDPWSLIERTISPMCQRRLWIRSPSWSTTQSNSFSSAHLIRRQ